MVALLGECRNYISERNPECCVRREFVPFSSFTEPKPNAGREEVWFRVTDASIAAFAGIWRHSEEGRVYAFLTCEPNPQVKPIHPKAMPVILQPEDYQRWLAGEPAEEIAAPFSSKLMSIAGQFDGEKM